MIIYISKISFGINKMIKKYIYVKSKDTNI